MVNEVSHTEIDSHADSRCVGSKALIIDHTDRTVQVNVAVLSMGSQKASIINVVVTYDGPDGQSYMIIINQTIYIQELHCLDLGSWLVHLPPQHLD